MTGTGQYLSLLEPKVTCKIESEEAWLPFYCTMDNTWPDRAIFSCCEFTEAKHCETCTFTG